MDVLLVISLLVPFLVGPEPGHKLEAADLHMRPRPTRRCGGLKMMEKWDAERELRLEEWANKAVGGWAHDVGKRLSAVDSDVREELWRSARDRWQACRAGLRPRSAVCVAVAARRPGLCAYAKGAEGAAECHDLVAAVLGLERGGPPLAPEEGLTPEICAIGDRVLTWFPFARENCDRLLSQEAIRTNEPGWCDTMDGDIDGSDSCFALFAEARVSNRRAAARSGGVFCRRRTGSTLSRKTPSTAAPDDEGQPQPVKRAKHESDRRAACLAVFAASPDLCPEPRPGQNGVLLDRACRDKTLDPGWPPEVVGEADGVRMRFAVMNAFPLHARCAATIRVRNARGERQVTTAWFDLYPAAFAETVKLTPVDVILSPASPTDEFEVETSCRWSLDEPGHGKAEGVMGLIGW